MTRQLSSRSFASFTPPTAPIAVKKGERRRRNFRYGPYSFIHIHTPHRPTGQPLSGDTHRGLLANAKERLQV